MYKLIQRKRNSPYPGYSSSWKNQIRTPCFQAKRTPFAEEVPSVILNPILHQKLAQVLIVQATRIQYLSLKQT
eukprot:m.247259 g.247259  ORF g.247259 m.247259 type:complete len:73 (+) comp16126_c0_seq9:1213-1431(+)